MLKMCYNILASLFIIAAFSTIATSNVCPEEYSMCPLKQQIVTPGVDVTLNCMTRNEFQECYWKSPLGHNIHPLADDKKFIREDQNKRNCNMRVLNVTARENGNWTCKPIMVKESVSPSTPVNLIVAVAPSEPHIFCYDESNNLLHLGEDVETIEGRVGGDINCVCTVPSSRPHATITWVIGGEGKAMTQNLTGNIQDVTVSETDIADLNNPNGMVKTTASLKFSPKAEWNGLHLHCEVYHVLLNENQENYISAPVNVKYLPQVLTKLYNPWKVEIGQGETKSFAFRSNPAPEDKNVRLAISLLDSISAGQTSRDGHFKLGHITKTSAVGDDMYEVAVTIIDMQKDLTTNRYAIKLSNDLGASPDFFFHVDMEGSGEVSDEGLSTALIVVITIVIIAIFAGMGITYWARQHNKMCFTRKGHKKVPTRPPVKDPEPVTA